MYILVPPLCWSKQHNFLSFFWPFLHHRNYLYYRSFVTPFKSLYNDQADPFIFTWMTHQGIIYIYFMYMYSSYCTSMCKLSRSQKSGFCSFKTDDKWKLTNENKRGTVKHKNKSKDMYMYLDVQLHYVRICSRMTETGLPYSTEVFLL